MVSNNISPRLEARVRRDYPPQATEEVIAFLRTVSDDHAASRQDPERLQAAAFILLEGDVSRIPRVKMLVRDWMSSVVLALAPPTQAGMASAVTLIVRQAGFAISIAALGATLSKTDKAEAFAPPFALAVFAALVAIMTALVLLPGRSSQNGGSG